jgi:hypothetical protein
MMQRRRHAALRREVDNSSESNVAQAGNAAAGENPRRVQRTLVGIASGDAIDRVAVRVTAALGVPFHARESSYYGDPYYSSPLPESSLKLTENADPQFLPNDPPEDAYFVAKASDCRYILWCDDDWGGEMATVVDRLRAVGLSARVIDHD